MNLTPRQIDILRFIRDSRKNRGVSPTMEELAQELGISKVTVWEHVVTLEKRGALTRGDKKATRSTLPTEAGVALLDELDAQAGLTTNGPAVLKALSDLLELAEKHNLAGPQIEAARAVARVAQR